MEPQDITREAVRGWRKGLGWTQAQLGEKLGVTGRTVIAIEDGSSELSQLYRLALSALMRRHPVPAFRPLGQDPHYNARTQSVVALMTGRDDSKVEQFIVPLEILDDLDRTSYATEAEILAAYARHRDRIVGAFSLARATGQLKRNNNRGGYILTQAMLEA